jgi:hypothetical protein
MDAASERAAQIARYVEEDRLAELARTDAEREAEEREDRAAEERYARGLIAQERRDLAANRAEGIPAL